MRNNFRIKTLTGKDMIIGHKDDYVIYIHQDMNNVFIHKDCVRNLIKALERMC